MDLNLTLNITWGFVSETANTTPYWQIFLKRFGIWFGCAVVLCLPSSLLPHQNLLETLPLTCGIMLGILVCVSIHPFRESSFGDDTHWSPWWWNHLLLDTPGAMIALPLTAIFGQAVGYNTVLLGRLAIAGLATQGLVEEWLESKSPWGWVAGWATMTLPFLLCELSNGISEVCAIQWEFVLCG